VNVIVLQVFVSLMLVAGSVALFVFTIRSRTLEHADRLSLAPLEDDARPEEPSKQSVDSPLVGAPPPGASPARGPGDV
jgi:hypothetical protein